MGSTSQSHESWRWSRLPFALGPEIEKNGGGNEEAKDYPDKSVPNGGELGFGSEPLHNAHEKCQGDLQAGVSDSRAAGRNPSGES